MVEKLPSIVNLSSPDQTSGIKIISPATGTVSAINSPFYQRIGEGVHIELRGHTLLSPIKGIVTDIIPAHGKVVVRTKNNLSFLMQLSPDYIQHHGIGIQVLVKKGQSVTAKQPLLSYDLYKIQQHIKPVKLTFRLLETTSFKRIDVPHKHVTAGEDTIFNLILKTH